MIPKVSDRQAMLRGIEPALDESEYVFVTTTDEQRFVAAAPQALGTFREAEGMTLILERAAAEALGFEASLPMRRIVLQVASALDGVGLTAAVASALATQDLSCNVVAAFHHDHVFVPALRAEAALAVLKALQAEALGSG